MANKTEQAHAFPYNPRSDRYVNKSGSGKLPGKRKVWWQKPGDLIQNGRRVSGK